MNGKPVSKKLQYSVQEISNALFNSLIFLLVRCMIHVFFFFTLKPQDFAGTFVSFFFQLQSNQRHKMVLLTDLN